MKKLIFFTLLTLGFFSAKAQTPPIMVCNPAGTSCTPYSVLDDAFEGANAGDYIYLPGGIFTLTKQVSKKIHIRGAGFETNGTPATGVTYISGDILLDAGASDSSFEGFHMTTGFRINGADNYVSGITLSSLNFAVFNFTNDATNSSYNSMVIKNCVARDRLFFGQNDANRGKYNLIANSFIPYSIYRLAYSNVKNIISVWSTDYPYAYCNDIKIENSIIYSNPYSLSYGSSNIIAENSIIDIQSALSIFVNSDSFWFDPTKDYHIKPEVNMPGLGIYEGAFPWKDGSIPSNPHIFFKNIANEVSGGVLPVQIKVSAQ